MRKFDYSDGVWPEPETFWQWIIAISVLMGLAFLAVIGAICWLVWVVTWPFFKLAKLAFSAQDRAKTADVIFNVIMSSWLAYVIVAWFAITEHLDSERRQASG